MKRVDTSPNFWRRLCLCTDSYVLLKWKRKILERISRASRSRTGMIDFYDADEGRFLRDRSSLLHRVKDTADHKAGRSSPTLPASWSSASRLKTGLTEDRGEGGRAGNTDRRREEFPEFRYDRKLCSFKTWLLNLSNWRVEDQLRKQGPGGPQPTGRTRRNQRDNPHRDHRARGRPGRRSARSHLEQGMENDHLGRRFGPGQSPSRFEAMADVRSLRTQGMAGA